MNRSANIERLKFETFDVLVIGGGITGAAAVRDAAMRGLRAALVEARDFGEGTSSRSSRLVHGGLRYLEQLEFDLVFEASRERRTLLRIAPHLVRPLEFLFPLYREGRVGKLKLDAGMWLYDALALFRNVERHQMLDEREVLWHEPTLSPDGLLGGARYFDAQVDDARLVLTTVRAAAESGAAVANRVEVTGLLKHGERATGVRVRDLASDGPEDGPEEWDIRADVLVNATGPWVDRTLERAGVAAAALLRPTRGTHIHVRRNRIGHERALIFESSLDGRIMFVLPWNRLTLIGTTDEDYDGAPEDVRPTGADVRYLLESTNRLFPEASLTSDDVISAWAGLRPLIAGSAEAEEGEVSREHVIRREMPGLLTIAGGKLTSHRAMGEEVIDRAVGELGPEAPVYGSRTAAEPLPGGDFEDLAELGGALQERAAPLGLDSWVCRRLARAYGTLGFDLLTLVEERPELAKRIVENRPYIAAEVVYSARNEMPVHLDDVVYRRTHLALETEEVEGAAARVADLLGEEWGWDPFRRRAELERLGQIREVSERFRGDLSAEEVR